MADRVTQVAIESVAMPTSGKVRMTQVAIETVYMNTGGRVRVTQFAIETLGYYIPTNIVTSEPNICVIC
jgi:hypothetical protein